MRALNEMLKLDLDASSKTKVIYYTYLKTNPLLIPLSTWMLILPYDSVMMFGLVCWLTGAEILNTKNQIEFVDL